MNDMTRSDLIDGQGASGSRLVAVIGLILVSTALMTNCIDPEPLDEENTCTENSDCSDDVFCNGEEFCDDGVCADGDPPNCPPDQPCDEESEGCGKACMSDADCEDNNDCTDDTCVEQRCKNAFNSIECDDEELCTVNDRCMEGVCGGTEIEGCCEDDLDCDDDNECTEDRCGDDNLCVATNLEIDCDDENVCTDPDLCIDGECEGIPIEGCCNEDEDCDEGESCVDNECVVVPPSEEEIALANAAALLGIAAIPTIPATVAQAFIDSALNIVGIPNAAQEITSVGAALRAIERAVTESKTIAGLNPLLAQLQSDFESVYPCGPGENGFTVCPAGSSTFVEGDYIVVVATFDGPIPLSDADRFYQYAVVFDSDGNALNNFVPLPAFPGDLFQNSDKWYSAEYDPSTGWTLVVTDAKDNNFQTVTSGARMILSDNAMILLVPAGELEVPDPAYRVTAFCHDGGFGFDGGFSSGDYEPAPMEPLKQFE